MHATPAADATAFADTPLPSSPGRFSVDEEGDGRGRHGDDVQHEQVSRQALDQGRLG